MIPKQSLASLFYFLQMVGLLITSYANSQNIRVEANFSPSTISSSSRSSYKIVIHGTQQNPQGQLPQVPGLKISNNPQSLRSANFINGVPSVRVELTFQVQPERVGQFTIPSWNLLIEGKEIQVPATTLQVLAPSQQEKQAQQDLRQAAFFDFPLPRSYFFEGETIMVPLTLFIWDRLPVNRIENAPSKIGESFSSNKLGKWAEEKRNVSRNGKLYSTFTWPVAITAAMAGTKEIGFEVNLRVRVNSRRNSPFSSPFFNDPFFGFGREESLTVNLPNKEIEIKPLPATNRPLNFSGAIGKFNAISSIDADQIEVGDPIRFNFAIEGKGNFAAIPAPVIESNENFKVGPPAFFYEGDEETKFEGKQNFEYIITPLKAGNLSLPKVNFSYFDPYSEKYSTIFGDSIEIIVKPGEKWIEQKEDFTENSQKPVQERDFLPKTDLFQTASDPGVWVDSLKTKNLEMKPWFWGIQIVPLIGVISLAFFGVKKRNKIEEDFRLKKNNLHRKLNESVTHRDAVGFFRAFKDLTRMLTKNFDKSINAFALSNDELLSFFRKHKVEEDLIRDIEEMLNLGESLEFAAESDQSSDFEKLNSKVSAIFKKLA